MGDRSQLHSRLRNTVRCTPQGLTVTKLDKALHSVRKDLSDLWMSSRHQKGLAGIVAFGPTVEVHKIGKSLQSPQAKSAPFVLSPEKTSKPSSPSPQPSPLKPALSRDRVRVCSPTPAFPVKLSQKTYRLARIPSPLALRKRYQLIVSLKNSADSNRLHYELGQFEVMERVSSPQGRGSEAEGCPLRAVRSFELQRQEGAEGSRPTTGRNRSVVLRRYHRPVLQSEVKQKRPEWSAACMTVTQLSRTHHKSLSMPYPPHSAHRPWRVFRQAAQAAQAHSESSSDAALFSGYGN